MRLIIDIGKKYPEIIGPISDAFAKEMTRIAELGDFHELVLDFSGLKSINSMAMGVIFTISEQLRAKGKSLQIINASEKIVRLLHMVNLGDVVL